MSTLHYVYDPLCGWCYAAAPLVKAARDVSGLHIAMHAGGMMAGAQRRQITPQWRGYVMPHDQRIAQITGQPFGEAYFEGLLRDTSAVMDSAPPTTAILAAEEIAERGLDMLHRLQHAHYAEGRRIADHEVLEAVAKELGFDATAFNAAYERLCGPATERHFQDSRQWLARIRGQGFPTFALEREGQLEAVDIGGFLGRPAAWADFLRGSLAGVAAADEVVGLCGPDSCEI